MLFSTSFRILTIKWSKRCFPNFKTLFEHLHEAHIRSKNNIEYDEYKPNRIEFKQMRFKCLLVVDGFNDNSQLTELSVN